VLFKNGLNKQCKEVEFWVLFILSSFYYFCQKETGMEMKSRRIFLRVITIGIASFFVFIWNKLTLNQIDLIQQKDRILPFNKNKQVSFFENYIVVNQNETTTVLSSHCTHLGCKINKIENGRLACPCHGSEYDLEGNVLKGPAYKNLKILPSKISPDGTIIEIQV